MTEGTPSASRSAANLTRWRYAIVLLGLAGWLSCFFLLLKIGTWSPFAAIGGILAAAALLPDPSARALLRPTLAHVGLGLMAGLLMIAATHGGYRLAASIVPATAAAAEELYALLHVGDFSPGSRAMLITWIASCEEVVFRGAFLGPAAPSARRHRWFLDRSALPHLVLSSLVYAAATLTLGSHLLISCAFACALAWGWLRLATASLLVPVLAHVVWDLGVLVFWPLV